MIIPVTVGLSHYSMYCTMALHFIYHHKYDNLTYFVFDVIHSDTVCDSYLVVAYIHDCAHILK